MEKQSTHSISADKTDTKQLNTLKRENSKEESDLNMQISRELQEYFKNTEFENLVSPGQSDLTLSGFLNNKLLIVFTIRTGIPYSLFALIKDYTPFTFNDWAEYLNISGKSLTRDRKSTRLNSSHLKLSRMPSSA